MENYWEWLQGWYKKQCNGVWEHDYGITIETTDNPGWVVKIDLQDTPLQDATLTGGSRKQSEENWIECKVETNQKWLERGRTVRQFIGAGGQNNLREIVEVFQKLTEHHLNRHNNHSSL